MEERYLYDVFLSWTGADRPVKNQIKAELEKNGFTVFDSDERCKSRFREECIEGVNRSRVYLLILSNAIANDPNLTGRGLFSEARGEMEAAHLAEARGTLNMIVLNISTLFSPSKDYLDYKENERFFSALTMGFSWVEEKQTFPKPLTLPTLEEIVGRAKYFIERRNAGDPVPSNAVTSAYLAEERIEHDPAFTGRKKEIEDVKRAFFEENKQVVVLSGLGGIGKTMLATEIAYEINAEKRAFCPQIVELPDILESAGGLEFADRILLKPGWRSVVNSAENERERRRLCFEILKDLPAHFLLVIDNYNSLTVPALLKLTDLHCKVLVTTRREGIRPPKDSVFVPPSVTSLDEESARKVFSDQSGIPESEIPRKGFRELLIRISGHTMVLCLLARVCREHRFDFDYLVKRFTEMSEEVEFVHNGTEQRQTVLGHLKTLFNMGNFNSEQIEILTTLCLISKGTMSETDLLKGLGHENRNHVIPLIDYRWLTSFEEGGAPMLGLHPLLSELVDVSFKPKAEDRCAQVAANYLLSNAEERQNGELTFHSACDLVDSLYFALLRLARNGGTLHGALFARYEGLSKLCLDAGEIVERGKMLGACLQGDQRALVSVNAQGAYLEQNPLAEEMYADFLRELGTLASDHKLVCRVLSETYAPIALCAPLRPALKRVLDDALRSAMAAGDDFAVFQLGTQSALLNGTSPQKLLNYSRKRVRSLKKTGDLYGEALWVGYYASIFQANDLSLGGILDGSLIEEMRKMISGEMTDRDVLKKGLLKLLRHPAAFLRLIGYNLKAENLSEDDPMKEVFRAMDRLSSRLADRGEIDVQLLYEMFQRLWAIQRAEGLTYRNIYQMTRGFLFLCELILPEGKKRELANLQLRSVPAQIGKGGEVDVVGLMSLRSGFAVISMTEDSGWTAAGEKLLREARDSMPMGEALAETIKQVADVYYEHGAFNSANRSRASQLYEEIFEWYAEHAPKSSDLFNVCMKLLLLGDDNSRGLEWLDRIKQVGEAACGQKSDNRADLACFYVNALVSMAKGTAIGRRLQFTAAMDRIFGRQREKLKTEIFERVASEFEALEGNFSDFTPQKQIEVLNRAYGTLVSAQDCAKEQCPSLFERFRKIFEAYTEKCAKTNKARFRLSRLYMQYTVCLFEYQQDTAHDDRAEKRARVCDADRRYLAAKMKCGVYEWFGILFLNYCNLHDVEYFTATQANTTKAWEGYYGTYLLRPHMLPWRYEKRMYRRLCAILKEIEAFELPEEAKTAYSEEEYARRRDGLRAQLRAFLHNQIYQFIKDNANKDLNIPSRRYRRARSFERLAALVFEQALAAGGEEKLEAQKETLFRTMEENARKVIRERKEVDRIISPHIRNVALREDALVPATDRILPEIKIEQNGNSAGYTPSSVKVWDQQAKPSEPEKKEVRINPLTERLMELLKKRAQAAPKEPSEKPAETPSETPAEERSEKPAETPSERPAETPAEGTSDLPSDPSDPPAGSDPNVPPSDTGTSDDT